MEDLSLSKEYGELTGFTEREVKKYFGKRLKDISEGLSDAQLKDLIIIEGKLKDEDYINTYIETIDSEERQRLVWVGIDYYYNGYVFNINLPSLYNPCALIKFLTNKTFEEYCVLRSGERKIASYVMTRDNITHDNCQKLFLVPTVLDFSKLSLFIVCVLL